MPFAIIPWLPYFSLPYGIVASVFCTSNTVKTGSCGHLLGTTTRRRHHELSKAGEKSCTFLCFHSDKQEIRFPGFTLGTTVFFWAILWQLSSIDRKLFLLSYRTVSTVFHIPKIRGGKWLPLLGPRAPSPMRSVFFFLVPFLTALGLHSLRLGQLHLCFLNERLRRSSLILTLPSGVGPNRPDTYRQLPE